jgi:hypothetical protein
MNMYKHLHMLINTNISIHIFMYIYIHIYILYIYILYMYMYVYAYIHIYTYMHIYAFIYMRVYLRMHINTNINTCLRRNGIQVMTMITSFLNSVLLHTTKLCPELILIERSSCFRYASLSVIIEKHIQMHSCVHTYICIDKFK